MRTWSPKIGAAVGVLLLVVLALPAASAADPMPPNWHFGDAQRVYRVLSANGTLVQEWERTFPDRPCEPPICNPASTICTANPDECRQSGTQTYAFRLDKRATLYRRVAYLITRRRSRKTVGAILFPVKADAHGRQTGSLACVEQLHDPSTYNPIYFSLVPIGRMMRVRLERTVFPQIGCIQAPTQNAMKKAGLVPTLRVSRARFRRSKVTLKFVSDVPFTLNEYRGTLRSRITIRLKRRRS